MTKFAPYKKVVVPEHGLGTITGSSMFADMECFEIEFSDKSVIKVPRSKMLLRNIRFPADKVTVRDALETLLTDPHTIRASNPTKLTGKYNQSLNSGELVTVAKLVRDLYTIGEYSASTAEIYPKALHRLLEEVTYVLGLPKAGARGVIEGILQSEDRKHLEASLPPDWIEALRLRGCITQIFEDLSFGIYTGVEGRGGRMFMCYSTPDDMAVVFTPELELEVTFKLDKENCAVDVRPA